MLSGVKDKPPTALRTSLARPPLTIALMCRALQFQRYIFKLSSSGEVVRDALDPFGSLLVGVALSRFGHCIWIPTPAERMH